MRPGTGASKEIQKVWPAEGLEFKAECPVCGSTNRELLYKSLRDEVFFCAPGEWDLFRCTNCGAGYLDPRPTPATIGMAYAKYYTHGNAAAVEQPPSSPWRRFRIAQRNSYLNARYGYRLSPTTSIRPANLSKERRQRFDKYVCFLPYPGPGARVLDIGCGNGRLMLQLRSVGWQVSGVEPDAKAAAQAIASGLDVRVGLLDQSLPEAHFDAITMGHVIEHLHDPIETLRKCARLLKPGGIICIITPNFAASGHKFFGRDWFALDAPRHLVLFTPDSLRGALERSGFEPGRSMQIHPTVQAVHRSTNWLRRSLQIKYGIDPMLNKPPMSLRLKLKAIWLAWQSNRAALARPEQAEELVLLARRLP
jgi:SAM-dependent methyltransferase